MRRERRSKALQSLGHSLTTDELKAVNQYACGLAPTLNKTSKPPSCGSFRHFVAMLSAVRFDVGIVSARAARGEQAMEGCVPHGTTAAAGKPPLPFFPAVAVFLSAGSVLRSASTCRLWASQLAARRVWRSLVARDWPDASAVVTVGAASEKGVGKPVKQLYLRKLRRSLPAFARFSDAEVRGFEAAFERFQDAELRSTDALDSIHRALGPCCTSMACRGARKAGSSLPPSLPSCRPEPQ